MMPQDASTASADTSKASNGTKNVYKVTNDKNVYKVTTADGEGHKGHQRKSSSPLSPVDVLKVKQRVTEEMRKGEVRGGEGTLGKFYSSYVIE